MTQTFPCPACGAPNQAGAGLDFMPCAYCGRNLTIPKRLRRKPLPKTEKNVEKTESSRPVEVEAANILRKSQPIAIRLWNLFALWTWLKWLIPTCFMIFAVLCIGFVIVLFAFS